MEINLLPFLVEAMGYNSAIYPDIDKLYQKRKYDFYKAAKAHELYNHQVVTEGGLLQEEYCKKALGILLCADDEIIPDLSDMFRKGWTYAYLFAENHQEIDLLVFLQRLIRKQGGIDKVSDDFINTNLFMCFYLAATSGKKIVENDMYKKLLHHLNRRLEHYRDDCSYRISLKKAPEQLKSKVKELRQKIYSQHGVIHDMNTLIKAVTKQTERFSLLFDFERLSILSIIDRLQFDKNDIDEILLAFVATNTAYTVEDAVQYLIPATYIKYLAKAYKAVKQHYFENNKETMYVELEGLERELASARQEVNNQASLLENQLQR